MDSKVPFSIHGTLKALFQGSHPETGVVPGRLLPSEAFFFGEIERDILNRLYLKLQVFLSVYPEIYEVDIHVEDAVFNHNENTNCSVICSIQYDTIFLDAQGQYILSINIYSLLNN
jgi:hypothetical protein